MADTSPGKVQALTAMFAQKNEPIMGIYRHGIKSRNSCNHTSSLSQVDVTSRTCFIDEEASPDFTTGRTSTTSALKMKVLPSIIKPKIELHSIQNGKSKLSSLPSCDVSAKSTPKPSIGPKPSLSQSSSQTSSSSSLNLVNSSTEKDQKMSGNCPTGSVSENTDSTRDNGSEDSKNVNKSMAVGEAIASFMFAGNASSSKTNNHLNNEIKNDSDQTPVPVPTPRKSIKNVILLPNTELLNNSKAKSDMKDSFKEPYSNIINSDNYICKNNAKFKRKQLPPKDKLGQPPLKPIKPLHMKLQSQYNGKKFQRPASLHPWNLLTSTPQKPMYPCLSRPVTSPPRPPCALPTTSVFFSELIDPGKNSILAETEELYEDTLLNEKPARPVSLIPEYTEEEEQRAIDEEDLYDDAGDDLNGFNFSQPTKPKNPPPPPPPTFVDSSVNYSSEELYQDALDPDDEDEKFYEVMPVDYLPQEEQEQDSPLYSNNRKEIEKLRREEEKRIRKELKEREKKEKEKDKLKKKFGLTGEEIPIDAGLVKSDCRGSRSDLPVKRNETVLILRMEGNPSGKWLVKNERGKIGYVELTNIEVMSIRRTSLISEREELYCEAASEEEAIYEMTY